jgi:hypothetical protein
MSVNLGSGVSRPNISATDKALAGVVWQEGMPPLDSELNLMSLVELEARSKEVSSRLASGWLFDELNSMKYFKTSASYSNHFYFGLDSEPVFANVNGWIIPVAGTGLVSGYLNKISLPLPPTSGSRIDLIFLEAWLTEVSSVGGVGLNTSNNLFKYGNVLSKSNGESSDLIDPMIGFETTKRIQIQYRIRTATNVDPLSSTDCFSSVYAQGNLNGPSAVNFVNMKSVNGDAGLYRAESTSQVDFKTVDNCVYAIPICTINRRNTAPWNQTTNISGALDRTPNQSSEVVDRVVDNLNSLPAFTMSSDSVTSLTGLQLDGTVFDSSFQDTTINYPIYLSIDQEIIKVFSVTEPAPNSYTIEFSRAQFNTVASTHTGSVPSIYHIRPDGLSSDQVAKVDILDLRHSISNKFDYDNILKTNVVELLRGSLKTAHKNNGVQTHHTHSVSETIDLSASKKPDGVRKIWSDAAVMQRVIVPLNLPATTLTLGSSVVNANPGSVYKVSVTFNPSGVTRTTTKLYVGDQIVITAPAGSQFCTPMSDLLIGPDSLKHSILMHFDGTASDPSGTAQNYTGTNYSASPNTSAGTASNGQGFTTNLTNNNKTATLTITNSSIWNETSATKILWLEFAVLYESGSGLNYLPSYVHRCDFTPQLYANQIMRIGVNDSQIKPSPLVNSPYIQTGVQKTVSETAEVMVDSGSKSIYAAPYISTTLPALMVKTAQFLNFRPDQSSFVFNGFMPKVNLLNNTSTDFYTNPNNIFWASNELGVAAQTIEIPLDYLPKLGLQHIPIQRTTNQYLQSGLNFILRSDPSAINVPTSSNNADFVSYGLSGTSGWDISTDSDNINKIIGKNNLEKIFGSKYTGRSDLVDDSGAAFEGIAFPPFIAPANISGVYKLDSAGNPIPTTNYLKTSYDGPTVLLESDENGDVRFVLNIKACSISYADWSNSSNHYAVKCFIFGFDRGFLQTNGRIGVLDSSSLQVENLTNTQIGVILQAPLKTQDSLSVHYSALMYQGDNPGHNSYGSAAPVTSGVQSVSDMNLTRSNPLVAPNKLALSNKKKFEVLSAINFVTSLGTGRLSASVPLPRLSSLQAPENLPEIDGSRIGLARFHSMNRVGYSNWSNIGSSSSEKYPVLWDSQSVPAMGVNALSEIYDNDIPTEFAGAVTRLPLGSMFRDKDFLGKTLYQARSSQGIGSIPLGTLFFTPFEASQISGLKGKSDWEGEDSNVGMSTGLTGVGGEAIIVVDGLPSDQTDVQKNKFRTTRGGAAYAASNPFNGGIIASRFPKARPNTEVGSTLNVTAFLVKSSEESVGNQGVHFGNELQLILVTQAAPAYFKDSEIAHSANGLGMGYSAVDRYRIAGRPLERSPAKVSADVIPGAKPLFQNKIYDDPIFFGSADVPPVSTYQETVVGTNNFTTFSITNRPISANTVQMFLNGVKLRYGTDYTVGGVNDKVVTYLSSTVVPIVSSDVVEFWYVAY